MIWFELLLDDESKDEEDDEDHDAKNVGLSEMVVDEDATVYALLEAHHLALSGDK